VIMRPIWVAWCQFGCGGKPGAGFHGFMRERPATMLTRKQHELFCFIQAKLEETGVSPSFEEMKEALDLKSKSGVHRLISALEERGFIRRLPNRARHRPCPCGRTRGSCAAPCPGGGARGQRAACHRTSARQRYYRNSHARPHRRWRAD